MVFTDRPRDFDHDDYWATFPALQAIASDPLHRCLEVEGCSGGKVTKLSSALRRIHRKFAPSALHERPSVAANRSPYFSQREAKCAKTLAISRREALALDSARWNQERCKSALSKISRDEYIQKPFRGRAEYVELVMALVHSDEYADQMGRRNKDATVGSILRRCTDPATVEYLLNGSRYIEAASPIGNIRPPPIGTTTNEALADY